MTTNSKTDFKEESQAEASQFNKSLKEIATIAATWFIPVVGLTYACGFLIVFTFFKNFGINTVEFIEAKYIHIGSLFLMACITIILPIRWIFVAIKRWGKEKTEKDGKSNWDEVKEIIK